MNGRLLGGQGKLEPATKVVAALRSKGGFEAPPWSRLSTGTGVRQLSPTCRFRSAALQLGPGAARSRSETTFVHCGGAFFWGCWGGGRDPRPPRCDNPPANGRRRDPNRRRTSGAARSGTPRAPERSRACARSQGAQAGPSIHERVARRPSVRRPAEFRGARLSKGTAASSLSERRFRRIVLSRSPKASDWSR